MTPVRPASHSKPTLRRSTITHSWQPVVDPSSGKTYYWNTATNETAWEIPTQPAAPPSQVASTTANEPRPSNEEIFQALKSAYIEDGSGMLFNEVARAHRKYEVFSEAYFEWLSGQAKQCTDFEEKDFIQKITAKLCNPLLRQPAPFEF